MRLPRRLAALAAVTLLAGCGGPGVTARAHAVGGEHGTVSAPSVPAGVLPGLPPAPAPTPAQVAAALAGPLDAPALGAGVAAEVLDLDTGRVLFSSRGQQPVRPASAVKFVVASAALTVLGPEHRLTTRLVTAAPVTAGVLNGPLVLVGGGDVLLTAGPGGGYPAPARLATLAADVARAGIREVTGGVVADATLFSGPPEAPGWHVRYFTGGSIAPISALETDGGRLTPDLSTYPRSPDPALTAGAQLVADLSAVGVKVAGAVSTGAAPAGARTLAAVQSPPLSALVESMLTRSDNDLAESLGRLVSLATGGPGSFAGEAAALPKVLTAMGIDPAGLTLQDASGLSRLDRVPPSLLARLLLAAASPRRPQLRAILTGLPVAAFSGTLEGRFDTAASRPAAGEVRAKTGTLYGVSSLAGTVVDASGRELIFVLLDDTGSYGPGGTPAAESGLDRVAAALQRL